MLKLHGFSSSNYYNVVKLALLEKELPFEEVLVYTGAGERYRPDYLRQSPLGKVPCLETDHGFLTESRVIVEYLEDAFPERPLLPRSPWERAKLRELTQIIDLYLELASRRVLPNFFARKPPPDRIAAEVREVLGKGASALGVLGRFDAFLCGETFTAADVAAIVHLPVVRLVAKSTLGDDPLAGIAGLDDYLARLEARPTVKKVRADTNANFGEFVKHLSTLYAPKA